MKRKTCVCVYDKDHISALRIKNTLSESDPRSYEVT